MRAKRIGPGSLYQSASTPDKSDYPDICPGVNSTSPVTGFTKLARSVKLHYAGSVAGGGSPPHPLSVAPVAIQILFNEG